MVSTKSPSWLEGYKHGKANLTASLIGCFPTDIDWGEYHVGYALGARDAWNDTIIDEWEDNVI